MGLRAKIKSAEHTPALHRAAKLERTSQISVRNGPCPVCENLRLSLSSRRKPGLGAEGKIKAADAA